MSIDTDLLQRIIEGALMASAKPLSVQQLGSLFAEDERPANDQIRVALEDIQNSCVGRGFELKEVAAGFRFQVVQDVALWVSRIWDEKPQKYSRALLETLALVAYRQPITRGDIESIRGVAVSSNIVRTLMEREWVRIVGHKDVPGRPAMYATTKGFLDYFNLKSLEELPSLAEIRDLDSMNEELALEGVDTPSPDQIDAQLDSSEQDIAAIEAQTPVHADNEGADVNAAEISSAEVENSEIESSEIVNTEIDGSELALLDSYVAENLASENEAPETEATETETVDAEVSLELGAADEFEEQSIVE